MKVHIHFSWYKNTSSKSIPFHSILEVQTMDLYRDWHMCQRVTSLLLSTWKFMLIFNSTILQPGNDFVTRVSNSNSNWGFLSTNDYMIKKTPLMHVLHSHVLMHSFSVAALVFHHGKGKNTFSRNYCYYYTKNMLSYHLESLSCGI